MTIFLPKLELLDYRFRQQRVKGLYFIDQEIGKLAEQEAAAEGAEAA